jgi:hypothetical protein
LQEKTMSNHQELYKFTFNPSYTGVLQKYEVEGRKLERENIQGSHFTLDIGANAQGQQGVLTVIETRQSKGKFESTLFTDLDGDGLFTEAVELEVFSASVAARHLEKHQFSWDAQGQISADWELKNGQWKWERIDANESYTQFTLNGTQYVLKTEQEHDGLEFEVFRNDNADQVWTRVAEGESTIGIDLVGLLPYLEASNGIIG